MTNIMNEKRINFFELFWVLEQDTYLKQITMALSIIKDNWQNRELC